jgi:hypothetical protein
VRFTSVISRVGIQVSVNVPIIAAASVVAIASVFRSVYVWRFGYRRYSELQIQSGQEPVVRLKVMNGRASAALPLAPFSVLMIYLAGSEMSQNMEPYSMISAQPWFWCRQRCFLCQAL